MAHHMYSMMVTRKGQDGKQTNDILGLIMTPMSMRKRAYREAHTVGTVQVIIAENGEWVGTMHGVDSPGNENLWFTESRRSPLGIKAQPIDAQGRLGQVL